MYKRLNLHKDKLPKRKKRTTYDDDTYIRGMYHPFLDTIGYEVEDLRDRGIATEEKGVLADYPDFEGIGWIFDSEIKDYGSLLKDRRNKMTQTFRYMLKQNSISSEQSAPSSMPSSMSSGLTNNLSRSTSKSSHTSEPRPSQMMEDLRRVANFFGFGGSGNDEEDEAEEVEEAEEVKKDKSTPPQSSSSSSSSRRSSNPALPVYQTVTPPQSVRSSPPQSVRSSPPQSVRSSPPHSVHSSRRSNNSARPSTILSISSSVASTIDYGFNQ